jgi:outer membrane protein insertion porin family
MHLPRLVGRLALVLLASAFAAPPVSAQLVRRDTTPDPEVASVEFAGATKAIDLRELQANIYTGPTACRFFSFVCRVTNWRALEIRHYLNRTELKRDVLRVRVFYYREGFREAQVDTVVTRFNEKQVAVRFNIVEGPPTIVTDVAIVYDSTLMTPKRVKQLNQVMVGRPLDLFEMDSTRLQFQNELWELGYADALVDTSTVVDQPSHTARVQFRLVKNHLTTVGDVVILGTNQVSERTVLNSLSFRTGDLYSRGKMLESQRNLYESNLFKLAAIDVPETFDSVKTVNVLLREAQLHEARIGGGFNTVDYLQTEGRYTAYNLFGGARRLDLSATAGNLLANQLNGRVIFRAQPVDTTITGNTAEFLKPTYQASIELKQPAWLQRPKDAIAIGAFTQRRAVPSVVIDNGYGGNLTFTHTLAPRAPLSLSYRFEVTRVEANGPYFCVNFGVCDTTSIDGLRGHQRLSPLLTQVQVDRSNDPLSPSRGYRARAELEHASSFTISDYRYNRAYAEGSVYTGLGGKKSVLASRLRIGFVRPLAGGGTLGDAVLHPRKRFYAGGSQSVRGYGENQLGPRILTLPLDSLVNGLTASGAPCDTKSEAVRFCDPNTVLDSAGKRVGDNSFTPRPLGGTSIIEGSIEYRFPLSFIEDLSGAVFVDGAAIGERVLDPLGAGVSSTLANLVRGTGAITPGIGVRYLSSVGPIRVDLGFNPSRFENLAVVTEVVRNGKREIIPLDIPRRYSAIGTSGGILSVLNRFTLHLSIGQAY